MAVAGLVQSDRPRVFETTGGVISPSVEGLTFSDYDVLSYVFASSDEQLPAAAAAAVDDVSAAAAGSKYLSEAWQVVADDAGPTLTQLNSEDLDATLLDEFRVVTSSTGFCVDMSSLDCSQLVAVSNSTSMPATPVAAAATTASLGWPEQQQQQLSQLLGSQQRRPAANVSCF